MMSYISSMSSLSNLEWNHLSLSYLQSAISSHILQRGLIHELRYSSCLNSETTSSSKNFYQNRRVSALSQFPSTNCLSSVTVLFFSWYSRPSSIAVKFTMSLICYDISLRVLSKAAASLSTCFLNFFFDFNSSWIVFCLDSSRDRGILKFQKKACIKSKSVLM